MGKFFEALKKSEGNREKVPPPADSAKKLAEISPKSIDSLKLHPDQSKIRKQELPTPVEADLDPRLKLFIKPNAMPGELFKILRAKILTKNQGTRPRSIMVTSPEPMDGKSTVAVNLAVSIAQGINEYVVLVDGDLRRPYLNKMLGVLPEQGLSEYLEKGTSIAPYLMSTAFEKLTLLPAGRPPTNPSELLSSDKMDSLGRELKTRYHDRYVIYDATPAQFAAETAFLAKMVDGVILVVRAGKTGKDLTLEAIKTIGREKILGMVFNAGPEPPSGYGYYYKYYHKDR